MIYKRITQLVGYALDKRLIEPEDVVYTINSLLEVLGLDEYVKPQCEDLSIKCSDLEEILRGICDYACEQGIIETDSIVHRDLFDTKIMGLLTPLPREVIKRFYSLYGISPQAATEYYYELSQNTDYIRRYRIANDMKWITNTEYGDLEITINLSKPEKDPKAIAAMKNAKPSGYPLCLLCAENEGYAGRLNHPARQNHRVIPLMICDAPWGLQYSPYVYYNEHCILFNKAHIPMSIDREAFAKLFDFIKQFPHYFIGSNADLPIVGGSILSHEHFQGGNHTFPMAAAPIERTFKIKGFEDVTVGIVKWYMSTIRLRGEDSSRLVELADKILSGWRGYSDESVCIFAKTDNTPHNTITPIARKSDDGKLELDLVLRNNLTTEEHPLGVYHPHAELHHIKKENIGLIEVMGLAVLPSRLKNEMAVLKKAILDKRDISSIPEIASHSEWAGNITKKHTINESNIDKIIEDEIGNVFAEVLTHAGVFKRNEAGQKAFDRFIESLNN